MGSAHEGGGGTCLGVIMGASALCRDRVGSALPLVFADRERRHSSSIILWAPCWASVMCWSGRIA